MQKQVYSCDGPNCTKSKGEANRWLIGQFINAPAVLKWGYAIGPWNDEIADSCHHFCGQSCALARLNEFLEAKHA